MEQSAGAGRAASCRRSGSSASPCSPPSAFGSYYLSRPDFETLYIGLNAQDVSRIGAALKEAGITFDVNAQGNAVSVRRGQTAQARMLLAEKGLPTSSNAGYELFDKMGSMGLTSFMQEITRLQGAGRRDRAHHPGHEGRQGRARAYRAAGRRVVPPHAPAALGLRHHPHREARTTSRPAAAIRHLVAAAMPGMTVDQVTVLNTDGVLMAAGGDTFNASPAKMLSLERTVGKELQDNVMQTLAPYLGLDNLRDQRGAAPQYRQAPDQRDELQSRGQGGAVGAHRQGDRQLAEQQCQSGQPSAWSRTFRRTRRRPTRRRRRAEQEAERAPRGADQLRGELQDHPDGQRRLQDREPDHCGGRQPQAHAGRARRGRQRPRRWTSSSRRSSGWSGRLPAWMPSEATASPLRPSSSCQTTEAGAGARPRHHGPADGSYRQPDHGPSP